MKNGRSKTGRGILRRACATTLEALERRAMMTATLSAQPSGYKIAFTASGLDESTVQPLHVKMWRADESSWTQGDIPEGGGSVTLNAVRPGITWNAQLYDDNWEPLTDPQTVRTLRFGDADGDNDVDGADVATVQANYSTTTTGRTWAQGDFNKNGKVNDADVAIVNDANGTQNRAANVQITAPATIVETETAHLAFTYAHDRDRADYWNIDFGDGTPALLMLDENLSWAGAHPFAAPGTYTITATAHDSDGAHTVTQNVTVTAATVLFHDEVAPHKLEWRFDQDYSATLDVNDQWLTNLTTAQEIPRSAISLSHGPGTYETFTFPGSTVDGKAGLLPDGNYESVINADGVSGLGSDRSYGFFYLTGDVNHDRSIDQGDIAGWSANYSGELSLGYAPADPPNTLRQGDVDYDGDVDMSDAGQWSPRYGTVLPAPPTQANELTATAALGRGRIDLNWVAPTGAVNGFHIYRSTDGGVNFTLRATVNDATATHWFEEGLPDGAKYTYRVRAFTTAAGESVTTNKFSTVTSLPMPVNFASSNLTSGGVTLSWEDASNNESGYEVWVQTGGVGEFVKIAGADELSGGAAGATGGTVTYRAAGLSSNTTYAFKVCAVTDAQSSAWTPTLTVTTPPAASRVMAPATPVLMDQLGSPYQTAEQHFFYETGPQRLEFTFDQDVTVAPHALSVHNLTTGDDVTEFIDLTELTEIGSESPLTYNFTTTDVLGYAGIVPVGNYDAVLNADLITNHDEQKLDGNRDEAPGDDYVTNFFFLPGDLNHDRVVDGADYDRIDTGYGGYAPESGYHWGDLNYSANIDADDYWIISQRYGTQLPAPPTAANTLNAAGARRYIDVDWAAPDAPANPQAYHVYRSSGGDSTFVFYDTVSEVDTQTGKVKTAYHDDGKGYGLPDGAKYVYRVRAYTASAGEAVTTNKFTAVTNLPMPSDLTVSNVTASSLVLNWTNNSNNETRYEIRMQTGGAGDFVPLQIPPQNIPSVTEDSEGSQVSYTVPGLTEGQTYAFQVLAVTDAQASLPVESDSVFLLAPPSGLSVSDVTATSATLHWTDNSAIEDRYNVWTHTGMDNYQYYGPINAASGVGSTLSLPITGLSPDTIYEFIVSAQKDGHESAWVSTWETTLLDPPGVPSGLSAIALSSSAINLGWTDNSGGSAETMLLISTNGTNFDYLADVSAGQTTYQVAGLQAQTTYWFQAQARNDAGVSSESSPASATTLVVQPPSGLTATVLSSTYIKLDWQDNSGEETQFAIDWSPDGSTFKPLGTVLANVKTFSATTLLPGTTYSFRVTAHASNGSSQPSVVATATTRPAAPTGLKAIENSSGSVELSWNDVAGETGYQLRRLLPGSSWYTLVTLASDTVTFTDTSATVGTISYALSSLGPSGFSASGLTATVTVAPAAPTSLSAIALADGGISLQWNDNSNNETGFVIENEYGQSIAWPAANTTSVTLAPYSVSLLTSRFRIRATANGAKSAASNQVSIQPSQWLPLSPPAMPQWSSSVFGSTAGQESAGAVLRTKDGQLVVQWAAADPSSRTGLNDVPSSYVIQLYSPSNVVLAELTATADQRSVTFSSAPTDTWRVRVAAVNDAGMSDWNVANVPGSGLLYLDGTPTLSAALVNGKIRLGADVPTIDFPQPGSSVAPRVWVNVEFTVDGTNYTGATALTGPYASGSMHVEGEIDPLPGRTYRFRAFRLVDPSPQIWDPNAYASDYSNEVEVTAPALPAPTNFRAGTESIDGRVSIAWDDNSTNEDGFIVECSMDGGEFQPRYVVGANVTSALIPGPSYNDGGGHNRVYRARAFRGPVRFAGAYGSLDRGMFNSANLGCSSYTNEVTATRDAVEIVAHRTGTKFDDSVSRAIQDEGNPTKYVVLMNNDFDADPTGTLKDYDRGIAATPSTGLFDDDLVRITIKRLQNPDPNDTIQISGFNRAFRSNGTPLTETTGRIGDSSSYFSQLATSDLDVWLEFRFAYADNVVKVTRRNASGGEVASDEVHLRTTDWQVTNVSGQSTGAVSSIDGSFLSGVATGNPKYLIPSVGTTFKNTINGFTSDLSAELRVTSTTNSEESYVDNVSMSGAASLVGDYWMLYSTDVVGQALTADERTTLKQTLHYNAVHNDGANLTLKTLFDTFTRAIGALKAKIRVDANRDGVITFDDSDSDLSDRTRPDVPYRFWLNDNDDYFDSVGADNDGHPEHDERAPSAPDFEPDFVTPIIDCARDVEDLSRVAIQVPLGLNSTAWQLRLTLSSTGVLPGLRLFYVDKTTAENYLANQATADSLVGKQSSFSLGTGQATSTVLITSNFFQAADLATGQIDWLFEGTAPGTGTLAAQFIVSGQVVASDQVTVQLQPTHQMYDTYDVNNAATTLYGPELLASRVTGTYQTDWAAYTTDSPETEDYILFVHGWRMKPNEKRVFADVAFKRLFWQGYKGRFGAFDWPTEWISTDGVGTKSLPQLWAAIWNGGAISNNFGRSEEKAWNSAAALRSLLNRLYDQYHTENGTSRVHMFAHSMGNVVASEALRQEHVKSNPKKLVRAYISSQAATTREAFDGARAAEANTGWDNYAWWETRTPDGTPYFGGLTDPVTGSAGTMINFFNPVDYAMQRAETANALIKPLNGYYREYDAYNPPIGWQFFDPLGKKLDRVTDRYTIFAQANYAFSAPTGRTAGIGGPYDTTAEVDLQQVAGFTNAPWDHSAEFMSTNATRQPYWRQLLDSFGLSALGGP